MRSLEGRLQLGLSLSLVLLIGGAWWLGHEALHHTAESFVLSRLQHDAEALLNAFHIKRGDRPGVGRMRLPPVYNQPYSGHYFALLAGDGERVLSRSLWDQTLEARTLGVGETAHWRTIGPMDQRLLVWGGGFERDGVTFSLAVAEDINPMQVALREYEWLFALMAAGGFLLMLLVQRMVVHQALSRLHPVYRDIERLERGETGALTEDVPAEILPLVRKLNRLLELYAQRLERSRNAAGNLAHALKGPINLMMQRLQAEAAALPSGLRRTLDEQLERIRRLMERELKRARYAGSGAPGKQFQPEKELPTLTRLLKQMHPNKALDIRCDIDAPLALAADREDMLELLGNLLDNACKWARSRVVCTVRQQAGETILTVEDDGPGCSETELAEIAGRGVRVDESVSGHGLGLAIAKDIVGIYKGRIEFGRSDTLGGFRAAATLPGEPATAIPKGTSDPRASRGQ